jgi:radical SAM protein with 4Fe4S-binding SPASM domain
MNKNTGSKSLVTNVFTNDNVENYLTRHFGEPFKKYRELWNIPVMKGQALDFPIHIDFELNDLCNQKCIMCPRNKTHYDLYPVPVTVNTKKKLSYEQFCRVIDECTAKGTVSINVGAYAEPLIHPDLIRMLRYARDHGIIDSILITNALLLNEKMSQKLLECGLTRLYVSLDAFRPETYGIIRGKGYETAKKNLLRFMEMRGPRTTGRLPWVRVSFIEMKENASEKNDFIAYWKDRVDHVDIQKYVKPDLAMNAEVLKRPRLYCCIEPWRRLAVRANGDILPCCAFIGDILRLGNIATMTIEEAWHSPHLKKVRDAILEDTLGACAVCQRGIY